MILNETYTLSNGIKIPKLGLGTWFIPDDQAAVDFTITPADMETLKHTAPIKDYGEFSFFPVFSGK